MQIIPHKYSICILSKRCTYPGTWCIGIKDSPHEGIFYTRSVKNTYISRKMYFMTFLATTATSMVHCAHCAHALVAVRACWALFMYFCHHLRLPGRVWVFLWDIRIRAVDIGFLHLFKVSNKWVTLMALQTQHFHMPVPLISSDCCTMNKKWEQWCLIGLKDFNISQGHIHREVNWSYEISPQNKRCMYVCMSVWAQQTFGAT